MNWTRREMLAATAGSLASLLARADSPADAPRMGVVIHSFGIRRTADKERKFDDPLTFLDYCRTLGAGGVQTNLGARDDAYAERLRDFAAEHKLYVEGSITLPRDRADVERFAAEVQTAKRCGASVFRSVLMNGRRYEVFDSDSAFRKFAEQAKQFLALARPVVEKHDIRMAVENHKDLRSPELVELLRKLDCPLAGVCFDTGNSIALLEPPRDTVELLAPRTFTTHIKDMGVEEYADGFRLAEVPLGTGFLDVPGMIAAVRKVRPEVRLNLEMITRDPLNIPCLTPKYWATLEDTPARRLADLLALVRSKAGKQPLQRVSGLGREEQVRLEEDNVRQCLRYSRERLTP